MVGLLLIRPEPYPSQFRLFPLSSGFGRRLVLEVREPGLGQHPSDADEDIAGAGLAGLTGDPKGPKRFISKI
jgi:hypothetical protein